MYIKCKLNYQQQKETWPELQKAAPKTNHRLSRCQFDFDVTITTFTTATVTTDIITTVTIKFFEFCHKIRIFEFCQNLIF